MPKYLGKIVSRSPPPPTPSDEIFKMFISLWDCKIQCTNVNSWNSTIYDPNQSIDISAPLRLTEKCHNSPFSWDKLGRFFYYSLCRWVVFVYLVLSVLDAKHLYEALMSFCMYVFLSFFLHVCLHIQWGLYESRGVKRSQEGSRGVKRSHKESRGVKRSQEESRGVNRS